MMIPANRVVTLVHLTLITVAAYLVVATLYTMLAVGADTSPPPPTARRPVSPSQQVSAPPLAAYRPIVQRNLFHTKRVGEKAASAPDVQLESLEQTKLSLKLWGTVVGNGDTAFAVIEDESKREQQLYRTGDSIQNATLRLILRNKVVLSVMGKDEVLEMENIEAKAPASRFAARALPTPAAGRPVPRRRISLSRSQVDGALGNLNELMGQINIQPHVENGVPDGMMLTNIKPNSIFRRMGLRNGDVLTGVDGRSIQSVDDALKLYEDLKASDKAMVEIKRKGRPTVIEYNIR